MFAEKGKLFLEIFFKTEMYPDNDKKGKNHLIRKCHLTRTKKDAYISNGMQVQNQPLNFIHKNKSLLPATRFLSRSPMAYNNTAFLDRLLDFGKR